LSGRAMAVLRMARRWSSAPDLPDVSNVFAGIAQSTHASDRHATLHGVVFDILVGSQSRVSPDMTADDLGHALCYHLLGSGRAGFASRRRLDRSSVLETGLTRARHEPAIGATKIHTPRRSEAKPHQLFLSMIFSENRYPPSDQVRGHAFPDHALAATGRAHCNSISSFPLS